MQRATTSDLGRQPGAPSRPRLNVDPVTLRVLGGAFAAIAKEMASALLRMSYSSIIRESEDLGCGLFDADGREICESDTTPMHIGSLPWYIRGFLRKLDGTLAPGDVIIHNHPYHGASHSPDVAIAIPIFVADEHVGFAAATAHLADLGGAYPGINADAFDVYAEAKLYDSLFLYRQGRLNEDLAQHLFDNVRTPRMNQGDIEAMVAACTRGRDRFANLCNRYSTDVVLSAAYAWMDYSEHMLRAEILKLPDGEYRAPTGWLDDDGRHRKRRLPVETTVRIRDDTVVIDLTGSSPEVPTAFNVPFEGSVLVGAYYAIRTILLDEATYPEAVPQNDGVFRPIEVVAPKGTIFNPTFPRACFARACPLQRMLDNIILALSEALPEGVTAGNSASTHFASYSAFDDAEGEYWMYLEINEGSYGGRFGKDGLDAVDCLIANTRNNPIEEIEFRFPMRTEQYELRSDPAAPGRWRGGMGIVRRNRFLVDGVFSCEGDRHSDPPRGIFGGWGGLPARITKNPHRARKRAMPGKVVGVPFRAGEVVELVEPHSGGYGDPVDRPREAVREDVADGVTTRDLAAEAYGVVIDAATLGIDEAATDTRRLAMRQAAPSKGEAGGESGSLTEYLANRQ